MAIQWLSRFTLSPSRSGYLSSLPPCLPGKCRETIRGTGCSRKEWGVVCPRRGSASSPRVIFHSCCANPSLVDATSTRSHSLGGRARHEFQCSDGQFVALFTSLSWKSWGIIEEAGLQGTWEQHRITTQLHQPWGQARPARPRQPGFLQPQPEMTGPSVQTHRTQCLPHCLPPCNGWAFVFLAPLFPLAD